MATQLNHLYAIIIKYIELNICLSATTWDQTKRDKQILRQSNSKGTFNDILRQYYTRTFDVQAESVKFELRNGNEEIERTQ